MKLSNTDKRAILDGFPNIELSYEKIAHKNVQRKDNIILAIPKGRKYFAWFRMHGHEAICLFLELDRSRKAIRGISVRPACFDEKLCHGTGTIIYGTMFSVKPATFFSVEDIFFLRGKPLMTLDQKTKLERVAYMLVHYTRPAALSPHEVIFGQPLIDCDKKKITQAANNLPYDVFCLQHRNLKRRSPFFNERLAAVTYGEKVFSITACITRDIYEISARSEQGLESVGYACIPDYKTSVLMNSLFRNIKENANLDALEESDDEEEFENIAENKFVDLKKELRMRCVYIQHWRSWKPVEVTDQEACKAKDVPRRRMRR